MAQRVLRLAVALAVGVAAVLALAPAAGAQQAPPPTFPTFPDFPTPSMPTFSSMPTPTVPANLGFTGPTTPAITPAAGGQAVPVTTTTVASQPAATPKKASSPRLPETGSSLARSVVAALCVLWLGWMAVVAGAPLRRSRGATAVLRAFRT